MNAANTVLFNFHLFLREEVYRRLHPWKAVRVLKVPHPLGDTVWTFYEFASFAEKNAYLEKMPKEYRIFLDEARCTQEFIDSHGVE